MPHFVILKTDALVYVLLVAAVAFVLYARGQEQLRGPWRQVRRRPLAMSALTLLGAFVFIGLLDSVHFQPRISAPGRPPQYSVEVLSALDTLVAPLWRRVERSYSAPFALYAYEKQTVELPNGRQARVYPRLHYAGVGLASPAARAADIARRALFGASAGAGAFGLLALALFGATARGAPPWRARLRALRRGETDTAWRTVLVTGLVLAMLAGAVTVLAGGYHVLGTDQVGLDVLYKSLKSIRTALVIGTVTTLVSLPFAIVLGVIAGYFRGWVDDLVQYVYTTLSSIPGVLLIAAAVLSLEVYMAKHADAFNSVLERADLRLLFLCLILGITSWTSLARLLRGETLKLAQLDYVQAAQALGASRAAIIARHIVPNLMHLVLITVVLDFSGLVLSEAVLTYVGVGVDPSTYSFGNMINSARLEMARDPMVWWNLASAFVFMLALVLAANLFADAVRDAFDPRLRR